MSSSGEHVTPMVIYSMILGLMEMLILMVGEMLAMLPSSKASWVGIGLLNQSICPEGIKSLVLIMHMEAWIGGRKASREIKTAPSWSAFHGKSGVVSSSRISSS
jgi:hypothetical protein